MGYSHFFWLRSFQCPSSPICADMTDGRIRTRSLYRSDMGHAVVHGVDTSAREARIEHITFGLLSDDEIRAYSVVDVNSTTVYNRGRPASNGVNDLRMGTTDRTLSCSTCGNNVEDCTGHHGHIEMPLPVYHGLYFDMILKTLRIVCFWCSRPVKTAQESDSDLEVLFARMHTTCRACRSCPHCGGPQPTFVLLGCNIAATWPTPLPDGCTQLEKNIMKESFTPLHAREIFEAISDDDCRAIGLRPRVTRPENMVPRCLIVPPPCVRPAIVNDARSRAQDDLTHMLQSINKRSQSLRKCIDDDAEYRDPVGTSLTTSVIERAHASCAVLNALNQAQADTVTVAQIVECVDSDDPLNDDSSSDDEIADESEANHDNDEQIQPASMDVEDDDEPTMEDAPAPCTKVQEAWERLQTEVCSLFNNTSRSRAQALQRSGAPTRTLKHRLSGKHGRVRENMMGKRCNGSARSVISPDPNIAIDEIGVPECVASVLTVPEPVNRQNILELTQRVRIGPGRSDGAAAIITASGSTIDLEVCPAEKRATIQLRPALAGQRGDVVERYLTDGTAYGASADVVVFNRQPSLHRYGMMVHRVRILPGRTFRLNVAVTGPYNADFDGDEMNIHVPCSAASRVEAHELMKVSNLLISPQANRPVIGLVQDSLLGSYLLTDPRATLTQSEADAVLSAVAVPGRYWLPPQSSYSGRQVFSALLPSIDMYRKGDPEPLQITAGQLLSGRVTKSVVGAAANGIVQVIVQDFGTQRAAQFLSDVQVVTLAYLAMRGFSMGIRDCMMLDAPQSKPAVQTAIHATHDTVKQIQKSIELTNDSDISTEAESAVSRVCSGAIARVGETVRTHLYPDNALLAMVQAGSKGNPVNYTQIMGCVGQQCINGARIGVSNGSTLPCFGPGDSSLAAHGFVASSYAQGLRPQELFYHAMGGREGLIDTAVCTAVTGYLQRRTVKGLEDKAVVHVPPSSEILYRPVVSASGHIVQLHYGGDGCDASRLERVPLPAMEAPVGDIAAWTGDSGTAERLRQLRAAIIGDRRSYINVPLHAHAHVPVNVRRLVTAMSRRRFQPTQQRGFAAVEAVIAFLAKVLHQYAAPMQYLVLYWLCSGSCARHGYSESTVVATCGEIKRRVMGSMIAPGEMVGIVAAQMIGEPLTQLTLNTFHLAGVGNQTKGIARIKELVDCTRNPKTPITQLTLRGKCREVAEIVNLYSERLIHRVVENVCTTCRVMSFKDCSDTLRLSLDLAVARTARLPCSEPQFRVIYLPFDIGAMQTIDIQAHHVAYAVSEACPEAYVGYDGLGIGIAWAIAPFEWAPESSLGVHEPTPMSEDALLNILFAVGRKVLSTVTVCGLSGVHTSSARKVRGSALGGAISETSVIEAHGLRLVDAVMLPYVDLERVVSNDVCDVMDVLGIEAARSVLLNELHATISDDGTYVNTRHLQVLVDTMCQRGVVTPMSRHGINRSDPEETMKKCSYEETIDVLSKAAVFGNGDNMLGVTPSVAFGQCCARMGTSATTVLLHPHTLSAAHSAEQRDSRKRKLTVSSMTVNARPSTTACGSDTGHGENDGSDPVKTYREAPRANHDKHPLKAASRTSRHVGSTTNGPVGSHAQHPSLMELVEQYNGSSRTSRGARRATYAPPSPQIDVSQ